jgi:phosphoglycolate phosphatase-like HAD superfamily hydrolase
LVDRPLLLFDIDGTLIRTGSLSLGPAYADVLRRVFGLEKLERIPDASGWLDRQIVAELARLHGIPCSPEQVTEACRMLAEHGRTVKLTPVLLPGVPELLDLLRHRDFPLAILTGNLEEMAWAKIDAAGLRDAFEVGAFGDEADERADLVPLAIARAEEHFGRRFDLRRVCVIGDTPRDVACAKFHGARSIAVATGRWTREQLAEQGADVVLSDLTDQAAFLAAVGSPDTSQATL